MAHADTTTRQPDLRLWSLAAGNFAVGTGSLVMAGLLPVMAPDLGRSIPAVGQAVTAYSAAVALGGPLLAAVTSRIDRRTLLGIGLALFALGHVGSALAPDYVTLLAARVLAGLGACLFTPHASATAALLVPPQQRGRAIALVFGGFTVATILGVPLGTMLGSLVGWRATLAGAGGLALVAMAAMWRALGPGLHTAPVDLAAWGGLMRNRAVLLMLAVTLSQILGQLAVFAYIAPLLHAGLDAGPSLISLLLAWLGLAGLAGNALAGRAVDRIGAGRTAHAAIAAVGVALAVWPLGAHALPFVAVVFFVWGAGGFAINTSQQARLVAAVPTLTSAVLPLNSSAIYVGQALGAALGGLLIGGFGPEPLPLAAAMCLGTALLLSLAASRAGTGSKGT